MKLKKVLAVALAVTMLGSLTACGGNGGSGETAVKTPVGKSPIKQMVADRYASFDAGKGKEFEEGKLSLEDVVAYAKTQGEPAQTSGKQELYEAIVNMYC